MDTWAGDDELDRALTVACTQPPPVSASKIGVIGKLASKFYRVRPHQALHGPRTRHSLHSSPQAFAPHFLTPPAHPAPTPSPPAQKDYKNVVHDVENFLRKSEPAHRLSIVYAIDVICRQKLDKYPLRFSVNLVKSCAFFADRPDAEKVNR